MNKDEAMMILKTHVKNNKLIKHCIAVSTIMKSIAKKLLENEEQYEILGLLHDVDYEEVSPEQHGTKACEILKHVLTKEELHAIQAHNYEHTNIKPKTTLDYALIISDAISGLIIATALVMPDKKLQSVTIETLKRKFRQKDFARNIKREHILLCKHINMDLDEVFEIALNACKEVANDLDL